MTDITGYIIHLERATARAAHVADLKAVLPCPTEILPAVDAHTLTSQDHARYGDARALRPRYPFALNDTEIAVFLSHRAAWQRIWEGNSIAGLIVEDDVVLDPDLFGQAFGLAGSHVTEDTWIRFPWKPRETPGAVIAEAGGARLFRPRRVALGMQAQIVGRRAAEHLLLETKQFDRPVDTFLQMTWAHKVAPLVVWPSGVRDISAELGGSTLTKRRRGTGARLLSEAKRAWYRAAIALR